MADPVPVTIRSPRGATDTCELVCGKNRLYFSTNQGPENSYWYLVQDRASLDFVVNTHSTTNDTVPDDVMQYAGSSDHIVYVMSYYTRLDHLPTGAMYTFLKDAGARAGLDRLIQIGTQLGTGRISGGTYVLAATLDTGDGSGIETATTDYGTTIITALRLQPFEVDGKAIYTPIAFG
jgi:hypothetical protein